MAPVLRLYEDTLSNTAEAVGLPPVPRMIFVVHGAATIGGSGFAPYSYRVLQPSNSAHQRPPRGTKKQSSTPVDLSMNRTGV